MSTASLKRTEVRKFSTVENFLRMRYNTESLKGTLKRAEEENFFYNRKIFLDAL